VGLQPHIGEPEDIIIMDICKTEIKKNIVLVDTGGKLTQPLARLNRQCNFKKVWDETYNAWNEEEIKEEERLRKKKYQKSNNEINKKRYHNDPEFRKKAKERNKKWVKDNREKFLKSQRDYYYKNRDKINAKRREKARKRRDEKSKNKE